MADAIAATDRDCCGEPRISSHRGRPDRAQSPQGSGPENGTVTGWAGVSLALRSRSLAKLQIAEIDVPDIQTPLANLLIWRERCRFLEVGEQRVLDGENIDARGDGIGGCAGGANRLRLGISILGVGIHRRGGRGERWQRVAHVVVSCGDSGRFGRRELSGGGAPGERAADSCDREGELEGSHRSSFVSGGIWEYGHVKCPRCAGRAKSAAVKASSG